MRIDVKPHANVVVITPHGALTREEADEFRQRVDSSITEREGRVVLDMEYTPYLDSAGIETLLTLCAQADAPGPRLANLGDTCREALNLTAVLDELEVFETVEKAIRSYKR